MSILSVLFLFSLFVVGAPSFALLKDFRVGVYDFCGQEALPLESPKQAVDKDRHYGSGGCC